MFRGRLTLARLGILALVHRKKLLRHGGVFCINPLALVLVGILDFKALFESEGVVERGAEIAYLTVVAQSIDMIAAHFEKALVKTTVAEIQRCAESADKGEQPAPPQECRQHQRYPFVEVDVENHSATLAPSVMSCRKPELP